MCNANYCFRQGSKCFLSASSFIPYNKLYLFHINSIGWVLLSSPFYRQGDQSTETLSILPRVTQLSGGRARIWTQFSMEPCVNLKPALPFGWMGASLLLWIMSCGGWCSDPGFVEHQPLSCQLQGYRSSSAVCLFFLSFCRVQGRWTCPMVTGKEFGW